MKTQQKWPDELIIIRHGQSQRNVMKDLARLEGKHPIWSDGVRDQDTPLTSVGEMQAVATGVELRKRYPQSSEIRLNAFFVSPYLRTRQTKDRILEGMGYIPKIVIDERIREIEFGLLDGLTRDGIEAKYPEEVKRRAKEGKYYYRPPGGESRPDVKLRIRSFIDTLIRDYATQRVVVVCHSVVVLAFRAVLERWDEEKYLQVDAENDVKNSSITAYRFDPSDNKLWLTEYNTVSYSEDRLPSHQAAAAENPAAI